MRKADIRGNLGEILKKNRLEKLVPCLPSRARVCVCLCVCVCVCVCFTFIHCEGFICLDQLDALSCPHTRSGQGLDLTGLRLTFRARDLHSPLTGIAFGTHYIVSRCAFASALTRWFAIYLRKAKVTTNFSIKSSPRQST